MSYGGIYSAPTGYPGSGGYASYGAPAGADPQLWSWFVAVDRDRSGAISADELHRALMNGDWSPFDLDTVKLLMNIFDTDRNGTIGFTEFAGIWKYIREWQGVFRHFDRDRSGTIDRRELQDAMQQFGYNLAPHLLTLLQRKYGAATAVRSYQAAPPGITFDRFVRACVVVKQITESFATLDTDRDGWVQINYEKFMETVLMLP